eukprot:gene22856-24143_t
MTQAVVRLRQGLGKNLYPTLSVAENLHFFGRLFGQDQAERTTRIAELLAATGLAAFASRPAGNVIVATAYMEEADRFDWLAAMYDGKVIASGSPAAIKASAGAATLDSAFIALLPEEARARHVPLPAISPLPPDGDPAIEADGLTCRFGDFTAVDHGSAKLFGHPLDAADMATRRRVGYMSQSFSLYTELTVRQNLVLHAQLFQLAVAEIEPRVRTMLDRFELADVADNRPDSLPLGVRQRLQLAVALIHSPEILILDEPTPGAHPAARANPCRSPPDLSPPAA